MKTTLRVVLCLFLLLTIGKNSDLSAQSLSEDALVHLQANADQLGLSNQDISSVLFEEVKTKQTGLTHVYAYQSVNGIPIESAVDVYNFNKNDELHFVARSSFVSNLSGKVSGSAALSGIDVLSSIASDLGLPFDGSNAIVSYATGPHRSSVISKGTIAVDEIRTQLIYKPLEDGQIRLAHRVEIRPISGPGETATAAPEFWAYYVDAENGGILAKEDMFIRDHWGKEDSTVSEEFNFSLSQAPNSSNPFVSPGSYRVYAAPCESPNHCGNSLEVDPYLDAPAGQTTQWHQDNATTYTVTRGNNVWAQDDRNGNNGTAAVQTAETAPGVYDYAAENANIYVAGLGGQNPSTHTGASVTNLFYWNNLIHDVWYEYGFDEACGNFQEDNFGRGGAGGDAVFADGQDGSGTNNANFATPTDGGNPRMQMFEWSPAPSSLTFEVNNPGTVAGTYTAIEQVYGAVAVPAPPGITGSFVEVLDTGGASNVDACEPLSNGTAIAGNVAFADRGSCNFTVKATNAADAGATALVVCNNAAGGPIPMGGACTGSGCTIPAIMISQADCATIRAETPTPGVDVTLSAVGGGGNNIDGTVDNGIIVHEYGHGISIRGTGGPATNACLNNSEQQGEGWSDWFGLMMTQPNGQGGATARGIGTYAIGEPITGTGIRTFPYSSSTGVNPDTYNDIAGRSVPHGVGSVWAEVIWDMTWHLVDGQCSEYGLAANPWDTNLYTGTGGNNLAMQLVMDGIKSQSCNPGFVDARDAILSSARNIDPPQAPQTESALSCCVWKAMAKRGLGETAAQGSNNSNTDQTEGFTVPAACDNLLPVEMGDFKGTYSNGQIVLAWDTYSETNNSGFEVEEKINGVYEAIGFVEGAGTSVEANAYEFTLDARSSGSRLFRLKQIDFDGQFAYSDVIEIFVGLPSEFEITEAYPNPFNPSTQFELRVAVEQHASVYVFDTQGRQVATLFDGMLEANTAKTISFNAAGLPSGIYAVKVIASGFSTSQTVTLLK